MCRHGRCIHIIKDCCTRCNHNEKKRDDWMHQNRAIFCVPFEWISKDLIESLNYVQKDWNHILKLKIIHRVLLNLLTGCELFDLLICCIVYQIEIYTKWFSQNLFELAFSNVTIVGELKMNINIQLNDSKFRFYWNPIIMMQKLSLIFKIYKIELQKKTRHQHFITLVRIDSYNYLNRCSVRIFIQLQNVFCKYTSTEI